MSASSLNWFHPTWVVTSDDAQQGDERALGPTLFSPIVLASFEHGRISRVALDDGGHAIGWVGGLKHGYPGEVWELHPLVVKPESQGKGVGSALVADLESASRPAAV